MIHTTAFTMPIELHGTYFLVSHLNQLWLQLIAPLMAVTP